MVETLCEELTEWLTALLRWIPGKCGIGLRRFYYGMRFSHCGTSLRVGPGCIFRGTVNMRLGNQVSFGPFCQMYSGHKPGDGRIHIGDRCAFNSGVMLNADVGGSIDLGNCILIGPNVVFRATNHRFENSIVPIRDQGHIPGKIVVEDDVWIGANVVVLPDVRIGKGAIVGAGAVVTRDVKPFSIVAGVPAREISQRNLPVIDG